MTNHNIFAMLHVIEAIETSQSYTNVGNVLINYYYPILAIAKVCY